ncbi:hypothetical protein SGRI78S_03398 [Streptomyces griseus subsp. griseus]
MALIFSRRSVWSLPMPWAAMPSDRIDSMFCRGLRLPSGSWKTIWRRRRKARISSPGSFARSVPSKTTPPSVMSFSRRTARPSVVLPQPDSPTRPYV